MSTATLDAAGRTIDGVRFRIAKSLAPGTWRVGSGAHRHHGTNGQQVNAKNLAAVMDVRPGAEENVEFEVTFAPDLRDVAVDALDGMDAHRRKRGWPVSRMRQMGDPLWDGRIRGCVVQTNAGLRGRDWMVAMADESDDRYDNLPLTVQLLAEVLEDQRRPLLIEVPNAYAPILTAFAEAVDVSLKFMAPSLEVMMATQHEFEEATNRITVHIGDGAIGTQGIGGLTEEQRKVAQRAIDGFDSEQLVVIVGPEVLMTRPVPGSEDAQIVLEKLYTAAERAYEFTESLKPSGISKIAEGLGRMGVGLGSGPAGSLHLMGEAFGPAPHLPHKGGIAGVTITEDDVASALRELTLEGELRIDDLNEDSLPEQPIIEGEAVASALEPFNGSRVSIKLTGTLGSVTTEGKLRADQGSHVVIADRPEFDEPEIRVGGFNLLRDLIDMEDTEVTLHVVELERPAPFGQPKPTTEAEDVCGKLRVALAAAKLTTYPDAEARLNAMRAKTIARLEDALGKAEALEAEAKRCGKDKPLGVATAG